jgi:hypothetical protein
MTASRLHAAEKETQRRLARQARQERQRERQQRHTARRRELAEYRARVPVTRKAILTWAQRRRNAG